MIIVINNDESLQGNTRAWKYNEDEGYKTTHLKWMSTSGTGTIT